jgi:hypothetical protein
MEGYQSLRTKSHIIEPLGYGILKKTVKRGAAVHSAVEQFRIQSIMALFESSWFTVANPLRAESPRSYIMAEVQDYHVLSRNNFINLMNESVVLNNEWTRFVMYMLKEGYFVRGVKILFSEETIPLYVIDTSLFGVVQGEFVKFPDEPWLYSIVQAELLYGIR